MSHRSSRVVSKSDDDNDPDSIEDDRENDFIGVSDPENKPSSSTTRPIKRAKKSGPSVSQKAKNVKGKKGRLGKLP